MYRVVDMEHEPRRRQYEYFRDYANPYASLTAQCDITALRGVKPFFLTILYCAVNAANAVPELRRRIKDGQVVEYDKCLSSHTVALPDETYCYCELDCSMPYADFIPYALERVEAAKMTRLFSDADPESLYFVSCVPWVSFTNIGHPLPMPADSMPRITFGKAYERDGRYWLPVDLTVNHALADGVHIGKFFQKLDENFSKRP